jgi:hypothetical protein
MKTASIVKVLSLAVALIGAGYAGYALKEFKEEVRAAVGAFVGREPYRKPEIAWRCGETTIGWANEDSGYESGSGGANDEDNTIVVRNAPRGTFVLVFHTTAHAFSTWGAKLDGKWCDQDYSLIDELGGTDDPISADKEEKSK